MHINFAEYVYNKLQALNILLLFLIGLLLWKIYQNYSPVSSELSHTAVLVSMFSENGAHAASKKVWKM